MRIGIDARAINLRLCGVGRVALSLINALRVVDKQNDYTVYATPSGAACLKDSGNFRTKVVPFQRYSIGEHLKFRSIIACDNLDIFHSLHTAFPLGLRINAKKIITVHDIMAAKYQWFFDSHGVAKYPAYAYFRYLIGKSISSADEIVAVSEFTKNDVSQYFGINRNRIHVVYNGVDDHLFAPVPLEKRAEISGHLSSKYSIDGPFLLFIGNFRKYKNIGGVLDGFAAFRRMAPSSKVILVIGGNDTKNLGRVKAQIKNLKIEQHVKLIGYVNDNDLPLLYAMAEMFLFLSIYEGFGIPPLEAMASGTPVLASNTTSLPEIIGDAGLLADPRDADDIARKINKLLTNSDLRRDLVDRGLHRWSMFNWKNSAEQMMRLYHAACMGSAK